MQGLDFMSRGHMIADMKTIIGTQDIVPFIATKCFRQQPSRGVEVPCCHWCDMIAWPRSTVMLKLKIDKGGLESDLYCSNSFDEHAGSGMQSGQADVERGAFKGEKCVI